MIRAAMIGLVMLLLAGCDDEGDDGKKDASISSITLSDGTTIEGKDLVVKTIVVMVTAALFLSARIEV